MGEARRELIVDLTEAQFIQILMAVGDRHSELGQHWLVAERAIEAGGNRAHANYWESRLQTLGECYGMLTRGWSEACVRAEQEPSPADVAEHNSSLLGVAQFGTVPYGWGDDPHTPGVSPQIEEA